MKTIKKSDCIPSLDVFGTTTAPELVSVESPPSNIVTEVSDMQATSTHPDPISSEPSGSSTIVTSRHDIEIPGPSFDTSQYSTTPLTTTETSSSPSKRQPTKKTNYSQI